MKIRKFNEGRTPLSNEEKAKRAGYGIGDTVYNNIMKKNLFITFDYDSRLKGDNFCTLGAVGENLRVYTPVKKASTAPSRIAPPKSVPSSKDDTQEKLIAVKKELYEIYDSPEKYLSKERFSSLRNKLDSVLAQLRKEN